MLLASADKGDRTATREIRERLIAGGVRENLLALPDWLHAGEDRQGQQEHA
jgi:hypothetical protein